MNATIEMIDQQAAREHMIGREGALLVCAYDDDQKFQENRLAGAIPFSEFRRKVNQLPGDKEIIFYCACPHDESARARAEEFQAQGFTNAKALEGGVKAWRAGDRPQ